MKQNYLLLIIILFLGIQLKAQDVDTIYKQIYFEFDSYTLTDDATITLENLTQKDGLISIFLEGHTDDQGENEYNIRLSENRVNTVKDFLISKNILTHQIITFAHGENKPFFENDNELGMAKNRRVDVMILLKKKEQIPEANVVNQIMLNIENDRSFDWLVNNEQNIQQFWESFKTDEEIFTVSNQDTILITKGGLIIDIPQNSFANVGSGERVSIKIHESLTLTDMLSNGCISMDSQGSTLQSGGMLHINAQTEEGKQVELQKELSLSFPTVDVEEGMELFIGQKQNTVFKDEFNQSSTKSQVVWDRTAVSAQQRTILLNEGLMRAPCCDPEKCLQKESVWQVMYWKVFQPNSYKIYQEGLEAGKEEVERRCRKFIKMQSAYTQIASDNSQRSELSYYTLSIRNWGYINCDKYPFRRQRQPMVTMKVNVPIHDAVDVFYLSNRYNIISRGNTTERSMYIPKGASITIFGVGIGEDEQPYFAIKTVKANNQTYDLDFKPITSKKLKQRMRILGR